MPNLPLLDTGVRFRPDWESFVRVGVSAGWYKGNRMVAEHRKLVRSLPKSRHLSSRLGRQGKTGITVEMQCALSVREIIDEAAA